MTPTPKVIGTGLIHDLARLVFYHLDEVKSELVRQRPKASKNVGVHSTAIGTTFTAKPVPSDSVGATTGGPARWS